MSRILDLLGTYVNIFLYLIDFVNRNSAFFMLCVTVVYVFYTFRLWKTAAESLHQSDLNQAEVVKLQKELSARDNYFEYRRIWNSSDMIQARLEADRLRRATLSAKSSNWYDWVEQNEPHRKWEHVSLVAHFIADLAIEEKRGLIESSQIEEGFPEFSWWIPRLIRLYGGQSDEKRLVAQLRELGEKLAPPDGPSEISEIRKATKARRAAAGAN